MTTKEEDQAELIAEEARWAVGERLKAAGIYPPMRNWTMSVVDPSPLEAYGIHFYPSYVDLVTGRMVAIDITDSVSGLVTQDKILSGRF